MNEDDHENETKTIFENKNENSETSILTCRLIFDRAVGITADFQLEKYLTLRIYIVR